MLRDFNPYQPPTATSTTDPSCIDCAAESTLPCLNAADQMSAPLDAKIADIASGWHPGDVFEPDQVFAIVSSVISVIQQAQNAIDRAAAEPNANQTALLNATDELARHGAQANDYNAAARQALASGGLVNAPSMKQWVLNAMNSASSAIVTVYVVDCIKPWWVGALAAFQTAFDAAWGLIRSIVGTAIDLSKIVIDATETAAATTVKTAKVLVWLTKWWPVLGLGLVAAGVIAYRKHRGTFRLPRLLHEAEEEI